MAPEMNIDDYILNLYYEDIAINIPNTSDLEAQGIKVYLNQNKTINIFNMYHPPNNKLIDDGTMAQFLTDNTIIVGDLNAKHQLWGCSTPNPRGKILSNLFDDNAFMCLNDGNPTHHSYSYNTAQALDISFSSPDIFHKCKWQILKSIGSDHLPILIEISTKTKTSSIKEKFWNFKKANWNLYQQNTNEDFREAPTRIKDLEQNWISFKNTIIKAAKVSIPRGNIKKWIPNYAHQAKDIQTLITKRNELQKKYTQNQTNCRTELNIVNAKIKRLYVNMKREKWKQTCENLNPRNPNTKLWHLAKQIDRAQPQTENTNMIKNIDGTPATNDKNAANLLGNSYQISSKIKFEIKYKKVEKKARKIIHDCKNVTSTHNIFHEKINMKELDYALENTDLNKTPGPDGIHGQMISNLGKNGKEKLLDIFNNSWKTGKLPQDWKTATIIPIKKLDKSADDPKNYRPISLTSICCKLMEKIILRRLTYHLDTRNLLPEEQYGFRKGHGTIDQLLFFTQKVKDAQNRKPTNHTIAAFLDLTQAFDKEKPNYHHHYSGLSSYTWSLLEVVSHQRHRVVVQVMMELNGNKEILSQTVLVGAVIPLMICYNIFRNLKQLSYFSTIANVIQIVGIAIVMVALCHNLPPSWSVPLSKPITLFPTFFGTAMYAFEGIGVVLPLENEMATPQDFGGIAGVLNTGMIIVLCLYTGMGFYGYLKYGDDVRPSITLNLPQDFFFQAVKLMFALSIFLSYALQAYVPFQIIWPTISKRLGPRINSTKWLEFLLNLFFKAVVVIFTGVLAIVIPNLDDIISLVGALASSSLALMFPPILECMVYSQEKSY
ncbi:hypothetical protein LAZ67_2000678, partial [Cordylochernes scorpioides]